MFNSDELTTIMEAAEVTAQTLDRPTGDAAEKLHALTFKARELQVTPARTPATLTAAQAEAIIDAVRREVHEGGLWRECQQLTLAQLCYAQADALGDDIAEAPGFHADKTPEVVATIRTLDELCDSHLFTDLAGFMGWDTSPAVPAMTEAEADAAHMRAGDLVWPVTEVDAS
jgi:hypothetical protein